jgi:putative acetyltransferase
MLNVRNEKPADIDSIRQVNLEAFGRSQEADLVDKLRQKRTDLFSLVATEQDRVVGHILFSPATIEIGNTTVQGMGLAPMAVLPNCQRRGIGSALIRAGIGRIEATGCPYIIVLGHQDYYPKFGFEPAGRFGIRCEWDVPDEAFMILIFEEARLRGVTGVARYLSEFAEAM